MGIDYNPSVVTDNLVLYLDAANTKSYPGSGAAWNNLGSTNVATTINGSPTFSNGVFTLNGSTQYMSTNLITNYTQFTLSIWCKPQSASGDKHLINKNSYYALTTADWPVSMLFSGTQIQARITDGTAFSITNPTNGAGPQFGPVTLNTWHNFVTTYNQSIASIYVDGVSVVSASTTIVPSANAQAWTIGRAAQENAGGVGTTYFNGDIAQVALYNAALSAEQVKRNFNAMRGRFGV